MKKLTTGKIWQFAAGQFGWALLSGLISNWLVYFYQPDEVARCNRRRLRRVKERALDHRHKTALAHVVVPNRICLDQVKQDPEDRLNQRVVANRPKRVHQIKDASAKRTIDAALHNRLQKAQRAQNNADVLALARLPKVPEAEKLVEQRLRARVAALDDVFPGRLP